MTSAHFQAFHWRARVLIKPVDGWTHIEASIIADDTGCAKAGINWVLNNFAFGREAVIRVEETDTHYNFDNGIKEPIYKGYVRFSYKLELGTWRRLDPTAENPSIQFLSLPEAANARS